MKDRDKNILTGVVIVGLAIQTCQAQAPTFDAQPAEDTGTSEVIPSPEFNPMYTGDVVWSIDQDKLTSVKNGMGVGDSQVSGHTININREAIGLPDIEVEVVYSQGPDIDPVTQAPIVREFIFRDGDANNPVPIQNRESFFRDGVEWMRESIYTELGGKQTVFEYPADAYMKLARGERFAMAYFPTEDVRTQLALLPGQEVLPILVQVSPPTPNFPVAEAAATPFSNVVQVNYTSPETASTLTPAEVEKAKHQEVLRIMDSNDPKWEEMGYLKDFIKNGGVLTERTIEFNGQQVEAVGFRIGMTEIWVAKDLVNRQLDYYGNDGGLPEKKIGEVIVPNENVEDWQYKIAVLGAYIHAANMGFGEDVLGYLQSQQGNSDNNYVMQDFREGADGLINIGELPPINPNVPVRMFIGNPTLTKAQAEEGEIYGGDPKAPYNLPYYNTSSWSGISVDVNGGITIASSGVLKTEKGFGNDYILDPAEKIYAATLTAVIPSIRSPEYTYVPGATDKFKYLVKTIVNYDKYSPLFIWKKK